MLNGVPVFALCTSRIHNQEVLESVQAFVSEARKRGYYVLVFNSGLDNNVRDKRSYSSCFSAFDLIPSQITDLIVIMRETLKNNLVADTIAQLAKENQIPVMCYDGKMDGVPSVYSYANQAFDGMLEHVLGDHGCKRVNLMTGIRGHYGSECMVMAYKEALHNHKLPFEEERVGYGDYWELPAKAAAEQFLALDTPEAIVCVNDEMAIAVCSVLRQHGLRVPEDVIVTGAEGIMKERYHIPRLTTCVKDYHRLCTAALDIAELILDGDPADLQTGIAPVLRLSESCGCKVTEHRDHNEGIRDLYHLIEMSVNQESEEHWIQGELLGRKQATVIDYLDVMAGHFPENACLCLRDCLSAELSESSLEQFADSAELMSTVLHRKKEKQFSMIARSQLIPDLEKVLESGKTLYVTSIYMLSEVYGYYVYYGDDVESECFKLPKFIHTAGNVIGSSLKTSRVQAMNEKLVAARIRDSLTGMLNLQGAMKALNERIQNENHAGERLEMVVIGLKRLRQINSVFGHAEGDLALLSLSNAINDCIDRDVTAARIGGDEFLIAFFSSHIRTNTTDALLSVLDKRLLSYNQVSGKSYSLEIAVGRVSSPINAALSLESMLNEAVALKEVQKNSGQNTEPHAGFTDKDAAAIDRILNENLLEYRFQPIINVKNGQIYAYEALMRSKGEVQYPPLTILQYATQTGRLYEIEWLTYNNVLKYIREHPEPFREKRIFINSIPGHFLSDSDFLQLMEEYGDLLPQVVVEFTEQAETDGTELQQIQQRCLANHMDIAVDDYGTGYSNISNLLRYSPNYVKIDRSLISNIHEEPKKQHFVTNIIEFAHANGFMALAEGVETLEELRASVRFGADLIQGNFTAMPSEAPQTEVSERLTALMLKFSASAAKQTLLKRYVTEGELSLSLPQLDAEKYTDIFVAQPELELIGDFDAVSNVHIRINDDTDCHILMHDVHLSASHPVPLIQVGRNSRVTLEFVGDNRMDAGGIHVPESSELYITGKGNLSISVNETKAFAIGADPDFACGKISIDLAGCLNLISNGDECIGIGGGVGKNQQISVTGTTVFIQMSGANGVGIGTLDDSCQIALAGCSATFDTHLNSGVAIGAQTGAPTVTCNTANITLLGSGNILTGIGSQEGGGSFQLKDSTFSAEITAQRIIGIGSGDGQPVITMKQCDVGIHFEGTHALDMGSYAEDADITAIDTAFDIYMRSGAAKHFSAADNRLVLMGGTEKLDINR